MARRLKPNRHRHDDALSRIAWDRLETLLAEYYQAQGYGVEHAGTGGTGARFDGGIDLKLRKGEDYIVVQCKHWNAFQVTHNAVHELLGIMVNEGATGAIVVTSGEFTPAAIQAANRQGHVRLVDGTELRRMLGPTLPVAPAMTSNSAGARASGWRDELTDWRWVARLVVPLALVVVLVLAVRGFIESTVKSIPLHGPQRPQAATTPDPRPVVAGPAQPVLGARMGPQPPSPAPVAEIGAAEEMMTPEQLAAWRKKNEESMRILERTTPELGGPAPTKEVDADQWVGADAP